MNNEHVEVITWKLDRRAIGAAVFDDPDREPWIFRTIGQTETERNRKDQQ